MVEDFFDNTVTFQKKVLTPDGVGGFYAEWGGSPETEIITPCTMRPLSENEIRIDDKLKAISSHRVYYQVNNIDPTWRAVIRGIIYDITGVINRMGEFAEADIKALK